MEFYRNNGLVSLLLWERDPNQRNKNNLVTLVSQNAIEITPGDTVVCSPNKETASCYEIVTIQEKPRPAALKGFTHYTVLTKWSMQGTPEIMDKGLL